MAPFAKTGGLADVAGSLPQALGKLGIQTLVVMPKYRGIELTDTEIAPNVHIHFVENEAFFNRSGLYGNGDSDYEDNLDRFSFFSQECLRLAKRVNFQPDIVHAHDWHTALVPVLLKTKFASDDFFKKSRSLLTIHNLAYQGQFPAAEYKKLGLPAALFSMDGFEFYGGVNVLKAGLLHADRLNAVSPTYAEEIRTAEYGCGLEGVLERRKKSLSGILNGLDTDIWDPAKDTRIVSHFSAAALEGKKRCKAELQKKYGFEVDPAVPVLAVVSRLAHQKGLDLLAQASAELLKEKVQLIVLGDGDPEYRRKFEKLGQKYTANAKILIGFRAPEAHGIYAGADFFLMPSRFEPCGLGQLIAMRYGAVPVVRATGGLKDTVIDADRDAVKGNGFVFEQPIAADFMSTLRRALKAYGEQGRFAGIVQTGMKADFSWDESAKKYEILYKEALQ